MSFFKAHPIISLGFGLQVLMKINVGHGSDGMFTRQGLCQVEEELKKTMWNGNWSRSVETVEIHCH
jgi:hypothetical protein